MSATIPKSHKAWAQHLGERLGDDWAVTTYHDDDRRHSIDIFSSRNDEGAVYATIGLQEVAQGKKKIRSEILLDVRGDHPKAPNVLATAAFFVMKDGWEAFPGTVFQDLVKMYAPRLAVKHLYFTAPFQWDDLGKVKLGARTIYPVLGLPITQAEAELVEAEGDEALETGWEAREVDVLDWKRR